LSEDTRQAILVAARSCFASSGFERATNQDIAAAAGVTAAAMYRYFESKPDLYIAVVRDAMGEILPGIRRALANAAGVKAAFRSLLQLAAPAEDDAQSALRFLAGVPTEMQRHPQVAKRMLADPGEIFGAVTELVAAGVRSGEISKDKVQRTISVMIATMMGMSAYANTLGPELGSEAVLGFIDLIECRLFERSRPRDG
jgi:AcrR family transcriptional regulator